MELLREGAKVLGLTLSAERLAAFERYYQELETWNRRFNLTAITDYAEVQCRHFLDSLSCLLAFPRREDGGEMVSTSISPQLAHRQLCLDVGSGAGFPGLPVKIVVPDTRMTLLEATGKKTVFLTHMVEVLRLTDVTVLNARAEEAGHDAHHRAKYDVVLARAIAPLAVLAEYCLPFCRVGGRVIAQKGEEITEEVEAAQGAIAILGGELREVKTVEVPGIPEPRKLVVITKVRETPTDYPRRPGMPAKRPLG